MDENFILHELKPKLESKYDCRILFIGEYGSRTFNMHTENSDNDLIAIFKPTWNRYSQLDSRSQSYQLKKSEFNVDLKVVSVKHILDMIKKANYSMIPVLLQKDPYYLSDSFYEADIINLYYNFFNRDKMLNHYCRWGMGLTRSGGQEVKKKQMKACYLIVHMLMNSTVPPLNFDLKKYAQDNNININIDEYQIRSFLKDSVPDKINRIKIDNNEFDEVYRDNSPVRGG